MTIEEKKFKVETKEGLAKQGGCPEQCSKVKTKLESVSPAYAGHVG